MKGKYEKWLEPENLLLIEGWARDGLTEEQIAQNMGVSYSSLKAWKTKYSAVLTALKKGKEVSDYIVENALYKKAVGYKYTQVIKERKTNPDTGECELIVTKEVTKEIPPDVTACIFGLKNRRPDKWRDRTPEPDQDIIPPNIHFNIIPATRELAKES